MSLKREIKEELEEIGRFSHIVGVLFREGLSTLVYELEIHTFIPLFFRLVHKFREKEKLKRSYEESLVKALERLGGLFVKAGEFLSSRPDLVTKEFAHRLEELEDKDLPFRFDKSLVNLQEFSEFNKTPVSAASFGQVHKAKLKDGTPVAVKIQRPKIEEKVKIDLKILKWLFKRIKKKKPELKKINLDEIYEEIKNYTFQELDYRLEAKNLAKLERLFKGNKKVIVPHVYSKLSHKKLLVMSWEEGEKISHYYNKGRSVQKILIDSMMRQYFDYGFFQGDPSPGNFFVREGKLIFLDLGMVGEFTPKQRKDILNLILAVSGNDIEALTSYLLKLNVGKKFDHEKFLHSNRRVVEESSPQELFHNLFLNALDFHLRVPPNFILFAKSIMTLATLSTDLNPKSDFGQEIEPPIIECMKKSLGYKPLLKFKIKNFRLELFSNVGKFFDQMVKQI